MTALTKYDLRRDEIVKIATRILNKRGVKGMTLSLVASELGLAPRAVSYYFRRKEDLAAACFRQSIDRMDRLVSEALKSRNAAEKIRILVQLFFHEQYRVATGEADPIASFDDMRTIHDPGSGEAFTNLFRKVRSIFDSVGATEFERRDKNARAHLLMSQLFWSALWLTRYNSEDYRRMGDRTALMVLEGLAAPRAKWRVTKLARSDDDGDGRFLKAATALINEQGYLGASVAKISSRLNVTKGSFYHHNDTKDDVVEQCFERTWRIMRDVQRQADAEAEDGLINLTSQAVELVAGQVSEERPLLRTSALAAVPEEMRPALLAGFDRITLRYASAVGGGIQNGSMRPMDSYLASQLISGAINAAAELRYWAPGLTPKTAENYYVRPLFLGILCPAA